MSTLGRLTEPAGKPAELFRPLPNGRVQCTACARYCQIGEGQVGLCGVRGVVNGKLYLLVYGKVIAGHVDPIEKKPVIHYRPGSKIFSIATTGCNWLCHPAGTKVLMSDGRPKKIEEILPGDSVWSYELDGPVRIRPNVVTHVGTRRGTLWEISYGTRGTGKILLTEEHPVLTTTGWKTPKQLKRGDSILKVWYQNTKSWKEKREASMAKAVFHCRNCGSTLRGIESWNRHRGVCYTRELETPPGIIAARRARMLAANPMKNPEVAKRALQTSKARFLSDPTHGWNRNAERMQSWLHNRPSKIQTLLYEILDETGAKYEKEFKIEVETAVEGSKSVYFADAAFLDSKLDVEVDGRWHYDSEDVKKSDEIRASALTANGWDILRIPGSYLRNHPEEVKALILNRLAKPIMINKRAWVPVKSARETRREDVVYGLECIPNHNYVADGIVVHNCRYCQNADISQRRKVEGTDLSPEEVVDEAAALGCEGVAYTYNQPTIFMEYARDVGRLARRKGLFNIFVSNGYDTPETVALSREFLDCITVDFKGSGETSFVRKYIGIPDADPVFRTLLGLKNTGVHIEITDLIVPDVGDDLNAARKLCSWVYENLGPDTPVHFLRFHPDYKMMEFPATPVKTLERHYDVARKAGLNYVYIGNVPGHPAENTYCPGCKKVLVGRDGYQITEYNLDDKNRCKYCGHETPIVGPLSQSFNDDRFLSVIR